MKWLCILLLVYYAQLPTLRTRQDGRHFADSIFKLIFLNETYCILIQISLKFVPLGPIGNKQVLVQILAWRLTGAKPLSGLMTAWPPDAYIHQSAFMS